VETEQEGDAPEIRSEFPDKDASGNDTRIGFGVVSNEKGRSKTMPYFLSDKSEKIVAPWFASAASGSALRDLGGKFRTQSPAVAAD
jgi:hypothetical protein